MENPRDNIERIRLPAQPVRSEVSVLKSDETIGNVSYPLVNLWWKEGARLHLISVASRMCEMVAGCTHIKPSPSSRHFTSNKTSNRTMELWKGARRFVQQNSCMYVQIDLLNTRVLKLHPVKEWTTLLGGRGENEPNTSFLTSATPNKTSRQCIIIVHLNRHHQNYPVQTLQTLAPTAHMIPFLLKKTRREGTTIW